MLNTKELAENVLSDLMTDKPLSDILLKMKIFASVRKDDELLSWVLKELNGYEGTPPRYRILPSGLKLKVFVPFQGERWIEFPAEVIKNDQARERLSNFPFHQSITEIECIGKNSDEGRLVKVRVPVYAYTYMDKFIKGDIQDAYQYTTPAAVSQILVSVKSVLIDFLLKVNQEDEIDFNTFMKSQKEMSNTTIIAGIVNTGSGDVYAQGATVVTVDNNTIGADNKAELLKFWQRLIRLQQKASPTPTMKRYPMTSRQNYRKNSRPRTI